MKIAGIVLGLIIVVATFLPWATVSFLGESITVTGLQGNGIISMIAAILYIVMLFMADKKMLWKIIGAVFALLASLIGLLNFLDLKSSANGTLGELSSMVSVGIGIWLVIIGGVLAAVVIFLIKASSTPKPAETQV